MRILLTGGAGYIGSACLRWLVRQGHEAIAYDNLVEGNREAVPPGCLSVSDIADTETLANTMRVRRIEAVMHFAAVASVPDSISDPEGYYRINTLGTKNVLDAMRQANVWRIVFSSTAATYGFHAEMPLRETSAQTPETPYGKSKLAAEWLIQDYARAYGLGGAILRYFNASGADPDGAHGESRRRESHLIPLILMTAAGKRDSLPICGVDWDTPDGTCVRDYVHTADLAQAHELAALALRPGDVRTYNLGSGTGVSVLEVLRACESVVGRRIPHHVVPRRSGDPAILVASPDRIVKELGWNPRYTSIRSIVETAWQWHNRHPNGYADREQPSTTRLGEFQHAS